MLTVMDPKINVWVPGAAIPKIGTDSVLQKEKLVPRQARVIAPGFPRGFVASKGSRGQEQVKAIEATVRSWHSESQGP